MLHVAQRFSWRLDPLIAEAKRRTRQRRLLLVLVAMLAGGVALTVTMLGRAPAGMPSAQIAARTKVGKLAVPRPRGFYEYRWAKV